MMDENNQVDNLENAAFADLDEAFASEQTGNSNDESVEEKNELPEKYQGKSAEELAEMHRNLESTLGRQSNELGELRKSHEQMVQYMQQMQTQQNTKPTDDTDDDELWYGNPKAATEKLVNQRLQKLEADIEQERKAKALSYIQEKHPDAEEIVSGNKFQEFIGESPYRKQILQQVRQNSDANGLDYLLSEYKNHFNKVKENASNSANNAIGETGAANTSRQNSKQKIRRSDIQRLRTTDPAKYEKYQAFIRQAYREDRVVDDI